MSAPDPWRSPTDSVRGRSLLVILDPAARRTDGESVRIARDVLSAGARTKICLPDGPEELERALARRGSRRPVVVGDDRALLRVVGLLHRERELTGSALSMIPVGAPGALSLSRALGVPGSAVAAARTALDGLAHPRDLLLDDSGGVVLGGLGIPSGARATGAYGAGTDGTGADGSRADAGRADGVAAAPSPVPSDGRGRGDGTGTGTGRAGGADEAGGAADDGVNGDGRGSGTDRGSGNGSSSGDQGAAGGGGRPRGLSLEGDHPWWSPAARTARTALTLLSMPVIGLGGGGRRRVPPAGHRLRVEADGILLADLDQPVARVSVSTVIGAPAGPAAPGGGLAEVVVHRHTTDHPVRMRARAVTVSGPDFHYRADALVGGPVRSRTWTVLPDAWSLLLPR